LVHQNLSSQENSIGSWQTSPARGHHEDELKSQHCKFSQDGVQIVNHKFAHIKISHAPFTAWLGDDG
jgi:hypothetical protein